MNFESVKKAVWGASYCEIKDSLLYFHRFSKETEETYHRVHPDFNHKLLATAGISLHFVTDSSSLHLAVETKQGSTRTYFSHDVFVNGVYLDSLKNFDDEEMQGNYSVADLPLGRFDKNFELGKGTKEITVYFPALVCSALAALDLDCGSSFIPVECNSVYLSLGDSITQGYDCRYPKNRYSCQVSRHLGLAERNLAIGGEIFRPEIAETIREDSASLVTVAFGSNDWHGVSREQAKENCEKYLEYIHASFPHIPVYVISPVWRKDCDRVTAYGEFCDVGKLLFDVCGKYPNFNFVDGIDFVPHDTSFFGDLCLHPNDDGFDCYAKALLNSLETR